LLGGLLLLSGYFVPLALTVLAAELYNILAFHLTLAPASIPPALVASVLWGAGLPSVPRKLQGNLQREACDAAMNCVAVIAAIRTA
jgi:hypothetical protein